MMPLDIRSEIESMARAGLKATEVERQLSLDRRFADRVPALRTIQNIAKQARDRGLPVADGAGIEHWTLGSLSPDEDRVVLQLVGFLNMFTSGRHKHLSMRLARRAAHLGLVFPEMDPYTLWVVANIYVAREKAASDTVDLDVFLAWGAWKDAGLAATYLARGNLGLMPPGRFWLEMGENGAFDLKFGEGVRPEQGFDWMVAGCVMGKIMRDATDDGAVREVIDMVNSDGWTPRE